MSIHPPYSGLLSDSPRKVFVQSRDQHNDDSNPQLTTRYLETAQRVSAGFSVEISWPRWTTTNTSRLGFRICRII